MTVNLSWCPRPLSEACTFYTSIIPIRMLKSCRLEAAQCQQTLEEPNSSWQQGRRKGPWRIFWLPAVKNSQTFPRLHGYVYPSEINSARTSSVSPLKSGANRNGPCSDFYITQTLSGKALAVLGCSSAIYLGRKWFPSFPDPCPGSVWFTNTDCVYLLNSGHLN